FVDVGVHQDGLVHVSAMSRDFVADPRAVVKAGEVVRVKVLSVDIPRKRISLTMRLDDEGAGSGGARGGRAGGGGGRPLAPRARPAPRAPTPAPAAAAGSRPRAAGPQAAIGGPAG